MSQKSNVLRLGRRSTLAVAVAAAMTACAGLSALIRLPSGFRFGPGSMVVNPGNHVRELAVRRWLRHESGSALFVLCDEAGATHKVGVWAIGTYVGLPFPVATQYTAHLEVSELVDLGRGRETGDVWYLPDHPDDARAVWSALRSDTTIRLPLAETLDAKGVGTTVVSEPWGYVANGATLIAVAYLLWAVVRTIRRRVRSAAPVAA